MHPLSADRVPRLAPGCRLRPPAEAVPGAAAPGLLLIPEGAVRLNPTALAILERCNGERPLSELIADLQRQYPLEDAARIAREALALLERLQALGAIELL